jgi:hypothetical protein
MRSGGRNMSADETRLRVTPNLAYGICLVVIGTALILDRLELVEAARILRYWPVGLVLIGLTLVIQSLQRANPNGPARSEDSFNAGHLVFLVIAGLIVSQALSRGGVFFRGDVDSRSVSGETPSIIAIGTRHERVVTAPVFRGGELTTMIGRSDLDLRKTSIAEGQEAVIEVFTLMGGATVRVPEDWIVDVRAVVILGHARDRRSRARDLQGSPRIVIRGFIMMGGLDIRS